MIRQFELFSGSAHPAEARIYASITLAEQQPDESKQFQLSGHLIGPQCEFAHTLSARIPFVARPSGETLLAEAIVPDPCFWTPELPFLYRAQLELRCRDGHSEKFDRNIGIRRLGVRGRDLYFEGKRFVLRAAHLDFAQKQPTDTEFAYARETWSTAVVTWPDESLCELANQHGMLLIADVRCDGTQADAKTAARAISRYAQTPAIIMVIADLQTIPLIEVQGAVRNLLIGQQIRAGEPPATAEQAQIIFAEVGDPTDFSHRFERCYKPIIAVRRLAQPVKIEQARCACDALQRDLAPYSDFAGYVV